VSVENRRRGSVLSFLGRQERWQRYLLILALDSVLICSAWYAAFFLRFEGRIPPDNFGQFTRYLLWLLAARLPVHFALGIHRWSFRFSGLYEAVRLIVTSLTGSALFTTLFYFVQRGAQDVSIGPPRLVIVMEFFLTTTFLGVIRFTPRLAHAWFLDRRRSRSGEMVRTIIVGAGSAGELLLRDLYRSDEHSYDIVGFVDDDRLKRGMSIGGRPVLGTLDQLHDVVSDRGAERLLFAIPRLPAARLRQVLNACADLKLSYKILPVSFAYLQDRAATAMLQDLAPDDLLPRVPLGVVTDEMLALIRGRRVLVTGAGGSIGSEICRQVARYGPASLVLTDINENELYFLYRFLRQQHPELAVFAEVADIRDEQRLQQLGAQYRPQDVFHAAAHKHVPLMEYAPEEAIKNNVAGCVNITRMAGTIGTERFVLISSDKAVNPSSVMGATKRISELILWDQARRWKGTTFTAVRFGNVLGSAGSVVPLFKSQIAAGGPVTVTHPECRRYLMTIPEAVGLVLVAGLGRYGDLCILEMGEPMLIQDLARLMITMAGLVPDEDIKIIFTGLRPGEKLDEQLMTDEEAKRSRQIREMIRVIDGVSSQPDLMEQIAQLATRAQAGDRRGVIAGIQALVPEFVPDPSTSPECVTAAAPRAVALERQSVATPANLSTARAAGLTSGG
jgi:FlaA1/EpsC-like NDP-sugar epimerase